MSLLEIILYSIIGGFVAIYITVSIIKSKKKKQTGSTEEEENEK